MILSGRQTNVALSLPIFYRPNLYLQFTHFPLNVYKNKLFIYIPITYYEIIIWIIVIDILTHFYNNI